MKLRIGAVIWFNMLGIAIDSGFTTDKFMRIYDRTYLRFQQGLGAQLAIPLPDNLPQPIDFRLVLGVGGTLGTLKRGQAAACPRFNVPSVPPTPSTSRKSMG